MTIDLTDTPAEAAFRAAAREWLRSHVPTGLPSGDTREGFARHVEWERELFAARWAVVSWPPEYGGRAASLWEWLVFEEEYHAAGAPQRVTQNGIFLLAPTLFEFGTPEQQLLLPRMAAAEDLWCQGWSEPGAGSDLASISSRAEKVDGGWRLNGQKTWTTRGAFCTHLFGLFRTDPGPGPASPGPRSEATGATREGGASRGPGANAGGASASGGAQRHRGLTYLLVPLDTPGTTVRGFGRLDGDEGFAEVFFDDAFLPDDAVPGGVVLGGVGEGWRVAMATTGSERGLTLRSPGRFLAASRRLMDLARSGSASPRLRDRVVRAWLGARAYELFTAREVDGMLAGRSPGARSSLSKLHWSELDVALHETALELLGPDAERDGAWTRGFQFSLSGPIYAGTNEIQRNIVAERLLGLPRSG